MVNEIRIYYEGDQLLKPGFSQFFSQIRDRARTLRCSFSLISADSGSAACRDFAIAIKKHPQAWNILLKDSEGPDTGTLSESLCIDKNWNKSHKNSIFWMVQMMESWFHADKAALESFYGRDFKTSALKKNPNVEQIPKADLETGLHKATKDTPKGDYFANKTSHGPQLLAAIDAAKVRKGAPNCEKLFAAVLAKLA